MGYNIYIGEAVIQDSCGEYEDELRITVDVKNLGYAPEFENDQMTGKSNARYPSYTAWADFVRATGLYDLFYNIEEGLMRDHPGAIQLKRKHLVIIQDQLKMFRAQYPHSRPRFNCDQVFNPINHKWEDITNYPVEDSYLARLLWLEFWVKWSLENCKTPVIYNS